MKNWYLLNVKKGRERDVKKMLERDLDVEVGIEEVISGYVGVYMEDTIELRYKIRKYPFIIGFIGIDNKSNRLIPIYN